MRITVLDGHTLNPGDNPWDEIAALGELTVWPRTAPDEALARAAGAEILLTNKVRIDAPLVARLPELKYVGVLATGFDVADGKALAARGIPLCNVPGYGVESVAQHVLALILELTNRVGAHDAAVKAGEWASAPDWCFWRGQVLELSGRTLGLVGLGAIARRVAALANAFGMRVLAYAPRPKEPLPYPGFAFVPLAELFAQSDVVSLHCPLTAENKGFVNANLLAGMKPGALLINTARGALVNEADLAAALASGRLAGAAVDVLSAEPPAPDNPLTAAPNMLITPHMAWASLEARKRLTAITAANLRAFLAGSPANVVNGV